MILKSREDMDMESYETRVILANNIAGILPCRLSYINEDTYFSYDITSRQSLPVLCESLKINKEDLRKILESILTTLAGSWRIIFWILSILSWNRNLFM